MGYLYEVIANFNSNTNLLEAIDEFNASINTE